MPSHKYLLLHRSPLDQPPPSPAKMQEMYAVWTTWKEKFKNNVLDMGAKLAPSGKVLTASGAMDGPYVEAKEIVGGYMIVTADSYDQAAQMAHEMFGMMSPGTRIEIREIAGP
ncbi:MAG TPA: YciI family protein [Polyangia bacterium]|nr:YciI family protein [Polyangia bacterium]